MPLDHLLILAVDGLRASALGAYGNTWFPTPGLDQLAADSLLLDACYASTTELPVVYRSLLESLHTLREAPTVGTQRSLPQRLSARGYTTTLVTDEPQLAPFHQVYDQCIEVENDGPERAEEVAQTALARLMAAACDVIEAADAGGPQCVWIHARGMFGPWDAPLALQESLLEEGDPEPLASVGPPELILSDADGPDAVFVHARAYAAQAMVLDACVEGLLEVVKSAWSKRGWMMALVGTRGFPLGEHCQIGGEDSRLFAEALHVPCMVRFSDGTGRLVRTSQLATHEDLLPTVLEWIEGRVDLDAVDGRSLLALVREFGAPWREAVIGANTTGTRSVRTPVWCLREEGAERQLFVRPDDRWETNDVAELCIDITTELAEVLDRMTNTIRQSQPMPDAELAEVLRAPVR